jgi:hypothetical protein
VVGEPMTGKLVHIGVGAKRAAEFKTLVVQRDVRSPKRPKMPGAAPLRMRSFDVLCCR